MKTLLQRGLLCLIILSVSVGFTSLADDDVNPVYQDWSAFKAGSFVTYTVKVDTAGMKTETEMSYTLKEVTADKVVLEIKTITEALGMKIEMPGELVEFPARGEGDDMMETEEMGPNVSEVVANGTVVEEGVEEELEINGQKIMTVRSKVETEDAGSKVVVTAWLNDEIPGKVVRSITEVKGMMPVVSEMVVIDFHTIK
jgi:hypothetical protein